ncbi:MAG TPA: glycosyltransferase family 2 protein [Rhabdochlamydiaceae bacterium]|jgi:hypothetical protein
MDLSIITVTYQSKEFIEACILSVSARILACSYEHIIVDNASTDGTVECIESGYSNYVHLIKNSSNRGFAAAHQQALAITKGRFLLLLNPDMQLYEGFLDMLIAWMEQNPSFGLASCKLLTSSHLPHDALRPCKFPHLAPYCPAFLKVKPFFCTVHPQFFYSAFEDDREQEVDVVRGAFMLVRREIFEKLGYVFDPRYFILLEDVDLCQEVKRLGYKVMYTPQVSCVDYFGRSFLSQTKAWKYLQLAKSFKIYVCKWHNPLHLFWIYPAIIIGFLLRMREWGFKASLEALKNR